MPQLGEDQGEDAQGGCKTKRSQPDRTPPEPLEGGFSNKFRLLGRDLRARTVRAAAIEAKRGVNKVQ